MLPGIRPKVEVVMSNARQADTLNQANLDEETGHGTD
jgi:hypothetical protein